MRRRLHRPRPTSVRTRITAAVALLAGLALTGAGLAVYLVQSNRLDDQANSAISVEMAEFQRLEQAGIDPGTGDPFADSTELMRSALESNVAQDNEALLAFWNGRAQLGQGAAATGSVEYEPFVTAVRSRLRRVDRSASTLRWARCSRPYSPSTARTATGPWSSPTCSSPSTRPCAA